MANRVSGSWAELTYQFDEILNCIHLKAFFLSLPAAYAAHFLGDWHLLEVWFLVICMNLVTGVLFAIKENRFSWDKIGQWSFKVFVHSCTIIAVGIVAHAASTALKYDVIVLNIYLMILIAKEMGSTIRNMLDMGWPVPRILVYIVTAIDRKAEKKVITTINAAFGDDEPVNVNEPEEKPGPKEK